MKIGISRFVWIRWQVLASRRMIGVYISSLWPLLGLLGSLFLRSSLLLLFSVLNISQSLHSSLVALIPPKEHQYLVLNIYYDYLKSDYRITHNDKVEINVKESKANLLIVACLAKKTIAKNTRR